MILPPLSYGPTALDIAQAAGASGLAFAVVLLARRQGVRLERESAAVLQFVTLALVLAAGGLTALVCVRLLRGRAFTTADQLALPPSGRP